MKAVCCRFVPSIFFMSPALPAVCVCVCVCVYVCLDVALIFWHLSWVLLKPGTHFKGWDKVQLQLKCLFLSTTAYCTYLLYKSLGLCSPLRKKSETEGGGIYIWWPLVWHHSAPLSTYIAGILVLVTYKHEHTSWTPSLGQSSTMVCR